jgi:oligopeptide transport system substrate-binding protein
MVKAPIAPIYQYTNGRLIKRLKGYPITNPEDVAYSRTMYIVKHYRSGCLKMSGNHR